MGNVVVSSPNKVAVISGPRGTRFLIGSTGWAWWCIEKTKRLSLELMTLPVDSTKAETTKGVRVNVSAVAQIKVKAIDATSDAKTIKYDKKSIHLAAQHFLGDKESVIHDAIKQTMEGHQRQILGTLTVEEIYKDRAAFSERVREHVEEDLANMGFELVSYTVKNIDDGNGYMESLGATQTALVKREAAEGRARNEAQAREKVAQYKSTADIASAEAVREAHVAVNAQKEMEALADRDLQIKQSQYEKEVNKAQAEAAAAGQIEKAIQDQKVVEEKAKQRAIEKHVQVEIASKEALRVQAEKEGISLADLAEQTNRAKAVQIHASAEAEKIKQIGEAHAAAVRAKGEAEAAVLQKKAEAFKEYGDAALAQMIVEKLPELAAKIAAPLGKTDKMVFVSNDAKGPSMLTSDVTRILSSLPETVEGLTGIDVRDLLRKGTKKQSQEVAI